MKRYFCDCCGEEVNINQIEIPCHHYSLRNETGYSDLEGNRVSGRKDIIDICNKCLNRCYSAFMTEFNTIKINSL